MPLPIKIILVLCAAGLGFLFGERYLSKHCIIVPRNNKYLYPDRNGQLRFPSPGLRWVNDAESRRNIVELHEYQTVTLTATMYNPELAQTNLFEYAITAQSTQHYIVGYSYTPPEEIIGMVILQIAKEQVAMSEEPFSDKWVNSMKMHIEDIVEHTPGIDVRSISVTMGARHAQLYVGTEQAK